MLDFGAGFYLIPHPPQLAEEGLVGVGLPDGFVHITADQVPHGGLALSGRLPLGSAHWPPFQRGNGLNDRQPVFPADGV